MTGTVKNVNHDKGYGFIRGKDGAEYFFHRSALRNISIDDVTKGREVTFEMEESEKGPRAEDIFV